jgi:hypothetical protein
MSHNTPPQDATPGEGSVLVEGIFTLTAEEREAVRFCCTAALPETAKLGGVAGELCRMHGDTLRSLLERLQ